MNTNNIKIYSDVDGTLSSHFILYEFANREGWVIVHERVPWALENIRAALNARYAPREVRIRITNTTRTRAQNELLARRYGWTSDGGKVSKRSFHLVDFGGIAVDFVCYFADDNSVLSPFEVAKVSALYFEYVKPYEDGHTHGDFRELFSD